MPSISPGRFAWRSAPPGGGMPEPSAVESRLVEFMLDQLDGLIADGCCRDGCYRRSTKLAAVAGVIDENGEERIFTRVLVGFCERHVPASADAWRPFAEFGTVEGSEILGTCVIVMPVAAWKELSAEVLHVR